MMSSIQRSNCQDSPHSTVIAIVRQLFRDVGFDGVEELGIHRSLMQAILSFDEDVLAERLSHIDAERLAIFSFQFCSAVEAALRGALDGGPLLDSAVYMRGACRDATCAAGRSFRSYGRRARKRAALRIVRNGDAEISAGVVGVVQEGSRRPAVERSGPRAGERTF